MKFIKYLLLVFTFLFVLVSPVSAQVENKVIINFFHSKTCPHCSQAASLVLGLSEEYDQVELRAFEVSENRANANLFRMVGEKLGLQVGGVPFTLIGNQAITGYLSEETTGREIKSLVIKCVDSWDSSCEDQVAEFIESKPTEKNDEAEVSSSINEKEVPLEIDRQLSLPIFGKINLKDLSLPAITFIVALLDGFNPCAMWTLVFLISLLLGMKDRKRMWILGITFILASGLVYFLFLSAWLNLFLFLGLVFWVRLTIALVALGAGIYSLYDYFTNKNAACKVTDTEKRQQVFSKLKKLVSQQKLGLALLGITLLAFTVNIVELFCSAGLPAIYTQILSLSNLPTWQYYLYLVFYIIIFMIDDLFVFIAAMITLKMTGIESKYAHFSRLIGGLLMLAIGILLILKPEWLMFS